MGLISTRSDLARSCPQEGESDAPALRGRKLWRGGPHSGGMSKQEAAPPNSALPPRRNLSGGAAALPADSQSRPSSAYRAMRTATRPHPNAPAPVPPTETVKNSDQRH